MADLTLDELITQVGELDRLKKDIADYRHRLENVRELQWRALEQSYNWNAVVVVGYVRWLSEQKDRLQIDQGDLHYHFEYVNPNDLTDVQEGSLVMAVGRIRYWRDDDGQGGPVGLYCVSDRVMGLTRPAQE